MPKFPKEKISVGRGPWGNKTQVGLSCGGKNRRAASTEEGTRTRFKKWKGGVWGQEKKFQVKFRKPKRERGTCRIRKTRTVGGVSQERRGERPGKNRNKE